MIDGPEDSHANPIWNDQQIGLLDGTTPPILRDGEKAFVDLQAVTKAREVFNPLLGPIGGPLQATRTVVQHEVAKVNARQQLPKMKTGGAHVPLSGDIPVPPPSVSVSA